MFHGHRSNTSIATVDSTGKVTGVAQGTATITCSATDGSGVTASCTVTVNSPTLNTGLVAYYPFNNNANDETGNGNNGYIEGTDVDPTTDRFGKNNSAYMFNGGDVKVDNGIDFTGSFTVTTWVNADSIKYSGIVVITTTGLMIFYLMDIILRILM